MNRIGRVAAAAIVVVVCTPASAYAVDGSAIVPVWLMYASGLLSVIVALVLLGAVLRLRHYIFGAAISSYTSYVVAAVACLAASALVYWLDRVSPDLSPGQAVLASNLLVTAAMGLLILYFTNVYGRLVLFAHDLRASLNDLHELDDVETNDA